MIGAPPIPGGSLTEYQFSSGTPAPAASNTGPGVSTASIFSDIGSSLAGGLTALVSGRVRQITNDELTRHAAVADTVDYRRPPAVEAAPAAGVTLGGVSLSTPMLIGLGVAAVLTIGLVVLVARR